MWLDNTAQFLGWPRPECITHPSGGGPDQYARLVEQKVADVLKRKFSIQEITSGILSANPAADTSEAPLAIVLQFTSAVGDHVLREAHRLCWNFSRAALLITLEPTRIQAWTCSLPPRKSTPLNKFRVVEPIQATPGQTSDEMLQTDAAQALHWINLVSGEFLRQHERKFRKKERADAKLVSNLRAIRKLLLDGIPRERPKLDRDICHALLARLIFTQFLFQRMDSSGGPAISQTVLDNRFDGHWICAARKPPSPLVGRGKGGEFAQGPRELPR